MKNILVWLILLIAAVLVAGWIVTKTRKSEPDISGTAAVKFVELEGGFYGLVGDDGRNYDPINLSREFQQDGLRVSFTAKERKDMASIHMWGTIIEIVKIEKLPDK